MVQIPSIITKITTNVTTKEKCHSQKLLQVADLLVGVTGFEPVTLPVLRPGCSEPLLGKRFDVFSVLSFFYFHLPLIGLDFSFKFFKVLRFCRKEIISTFAPAIWEFSSVGSEHLPYKQRVTGSNPVTPTSTSATYEIYSSGFFVS